MHYFFLSDLHMIHHNTVSSIEEKVDFPMILFPLSVTCTFFLDDCNISFYPYTSGIYQADSLVLSRTCQNLLISSLGPFFSLGILFSATEIFSLSFPST